MRTYTVRQQTVSSPCCKQKINHFFVYKSLETQYNTRHNPQYSERNTTMSRRANGFGTLVSKGEGKPYLARWCYDGKVYTKSTGEVDRNKALKVLEKLTRPFREDTKIEVLRSLEAKVKAAGDLKLLAKSLKLKDLANAYRMSICAKDISSGTLSMYVSFINSVVTFLTNERGCRNMKDVSRADAEAYLVSIADKVCGDTYNMRLVFYRKLWSVLATEGGVSENVWDGFKKLKVSKALGRRTFTTSELARILTEVRNDEQLLLLIALGVYTGMRISDCAMLKWESVDLESRIIRVVPIKTRRFMNGPIEIPLHQTLWQLLKNWWVKREENNSFVCKANAEAYKKRSLIPCIMEMLKRCGIETNARDEKGRLKIVASFHSLRHTFITIAIESGMNPFLVQAIVGHSSVDMTKHYFHVKLDSIREGIDKIEIKGISDFVDAKAV